MPSTDPASPAAALDVGGVLIQPGESIGPYVYQRRVGRGGMAEVVLGLDPGGNQVALKILHRDRFRTGLDRFRREYRALSRIHHPNIIRVEAYGDIHGHPYIAMEYVEGTDLHQTIRGFKSLSDPAERWRRCERILVDVCRALDQVHQRGLVHRDLKPSNILITRELRAKLTDFGIVKELDPQAEDVDGKLVGTWAYASPEQISGRPIDHRSDLYSLGVILFAMLTGRRPFAGEDLDSYRLAHLEQPPPRPSDISPGVPEHLEEICLRLLRKTPRDRFQSAREVLYRLEQLKPEALPPPGPDGWTAPLVGVRPQLEQLEDMVADLREGFGGVVLVRGPDGSGRSRLLDAVRQHAALHGLSAVQLTVRKDTRGMGALVAYLRTLLEELQSRAPAAAREALATWQGHPQRRSDAAADVVDGIQECLDLLLEEGPQLLLLDDLHHAGRRELELLGQLLTRTVVNRRFLLVASIRTPLEPPFEVSLQTAISGERAGLHPTELELAPLDQAAVVELMASLIGPGDRAEALGQRLHAVTGGTPLFVVQFVLTLVQHGVLVPGPERWELRADLRQIAEGHLEIPREVRLVVKERLAWLRSSERAVLEALAVAGRELEFDQLLEVLAEPEEVLLDLLDPLVARGLLVEQRTDQRLDVELAHTLVGEIVYRELSTRARKTLHRRLARSYESRLDRMPAAIQLVGEHYRQAGDADRAYRHLVAAAVQLQARSLPGQAWEVASRATALEELAASEMAEGDIVPIRLQLLHVRGDLHYARGEWEEARRCFVAGLDQATAADVPRLAVRARVQLGNALARLDRVDEAHEAFAAALTQARALHDREAVVDALYGQASLAWQDGNLDLCEARAQEGLVLAIGPDLHKVRAELLIALTAVQASRGQLTSASRGLEEADGLLRKVGHRRARVVVLCNLAELELWRGRLGPALLHADEAENEARQLGYALGRVAARRVRGEVRLELGDLAAAGEDLESALGEAGELQLTAEVIAARYALGRIAARRGDPARTEAHVSVARVQSRRRDPERYEPALVALNAWACALTGDVTDARRMLDIAERGLEKLPVPRRCQVMLEAAKAHAALDDAAEAQRLAAGAAGLASSRGFRLWDLEARLLLSRLSEEPAAAAAWRQEAARRAEEVLAELTPEAAKSFQGRPDLVLALP